MTWDTTVERSFQNHHYERVYKMDGMKWIGSAEPVENHKNDKQHRIQNCYIIL